MRKWLIFLAALLCSTTVGAVTVWKWVDKAGVPHYTDHEVPGAQRIELSGVPTIRGATVPAQQATDKPAAAPAAASPYQRLAITSPAEQQVLWNIGAMLPVELAVSPALRAGDRIDVLLDGKPVPVAATSTKFTVPGVYRGVHSMAAVIKDSSGNELKRSLPITFMVQQTSVLNPNNNTPPAVRRRGGTG